MQSRPRAWWRHALLSVGMLTATALPTAAAPTGLNTIPTADLVPLRNWTLGAQNLNTSLRDSPTVWRQPQLVLQTQFGLTADVEGGIDVAPARPPRDYSPQFNLKWRVMSEGYAQPAVAAGIFGAGPLVQSSGFLVVSRTLNFDQIQYQRFRAHHRNLKLRGRRLHAGLLHVPHHTLGFAGTDLELSNRFVVYADWIAGGQNAATLGGVYVLSPVDSVTASLLYSNARKRLDGVSLAYSRTLKW